MNNYKEDINNLKKLNYNLKYTNYNIKKDIKLLHKKKIDKDNKYYKTSLQLRECIENILNHEF